MTGYIYNGYGRYEKRGKEEGITLKYAGAEFWLPYKKVTAIPDFHFREFDHAATAEEWEAGNEAAMVYRVLRVPGARVVEELTMTQEPVKNREKGILPLLVHRDKLAKDKYIKVSAGVDENGTLLFEEVPVLIPSPEEVALAETMSLEYRRVMIENYFDSKRERMAGGIGQKHPTGLIKEYMKELGVKDIDQVSVAQQQNEARTQSQGIDPKFVQDFLALIAAAVHKGIPAEQAQALARQAAPKNAKPSAEEQEKISEAAFG